MIELAQEQRENWGTRGGFVLAAIGSAVGLGNLWGFPYKIYSYGGGAFLIPYITAMICIGIPMLILEFSLGHFTQRAAPDAFRRANRKLEFAGWWGIILGFVIITYYPIILAYCFSYLYYSLAGIFSGGELPWAGKGLQGVKLAETFFFSDYLGYESGPALGALRINIVVPLIIAWIAMYFCIFRGVKLVGKIVWLTVPLPWLMLFILAVRGLTLPGSMDGLVYYLDPDWTELLKPSTWRFAFGQVFFSLSLAFGVMITYSSFLHRKSDLNNNAAIIGLADFATSFIAGIALFATLGGMAFVTSQAGNPVAVENVVKGGPGLAFVAFPYALAQLPASAWWSFVFFFTLVTLGIDSAFSITESVLAGIVDKTGWNRTLVLILMSLAGLCMGLFYATQGGLDWLGTIDAFINGTWGIAFIGLLECAVLGWVYRLETLREHANERSDWRLGKWWNYVVRIFIPVVLGTLFVWNLYDDLTSENGFLKTHDGNWNIFNCVGIMVIVICGIAALTIPMFKGVRRQDSPSGETETLSTKEISGVNSGRTAMAVAAVSAVLMILLFLFKTGAAEWFLVILAILTAVTALILANIIVEKNSGLFTRPSWSARLAGILSTLDISAVIAYILIYVTQNIDLPEKQTPDADSLGGVSYLILAVVFIIIIGGLSWCFYRAFRAAVTESQRPQSEEE